MKKALLAATLIASCVPAFSQTQSWGYDKNNGPEQWGKLSTEYAVCAAGKNQSPIDIHDALKTRHEKIKFAFHPAKQQIVNNGHAIQVNVNEDDTLQLDHATYTLQQFHFHAPSENTIDGKHFPMEGHFVFKDKDGNLTVVAVMFKEGAKNEQLEHAWQQMPANVNGQANLKELVDINGLFPKKWAYYRFSGSLTTPPCSEGVRWIVMHTPVEVSAEQINKFRSIMKHDNNRNVQPLNGRVITK